MQDASRDELNEQIIETINTRKPQTVRQLVDLVRGDSRWPEEEIVNRVLFLQENGKIQLTLQPILNKRFTSYLRLSSALWYWITVALSLITVLVVFAVPENYYPLVYVRYALAAIFVLGLPGYALIRALFPQTLPLSGALARFLETSEKSLDTIERVALSVGMSLALVPLVGLLLNYTPWGIRLTPIVLSLTTLTIAFATAGVLREHQINKKPL